MNKKKIFRGCLIVVSAIVVIIIILFILFVYSFSQPQDTKMKVMNEPNKFIVEQFDLDPKSVIYQYYESYGFTDICEDIIFVVRYKNAVRLQKSLPLSKEDKIFISNISNINSGIVEGTSFSPICEYKNKYSDISWGCSEYIKDSLLMVNLSKGSYQIIESRYNKELDNYDSVKLEIFDSDKNILYTQIYQCDGS